MALTRLNAFATGSIVTNSIITGEFDNLYNNALTLISPLTADLAAGGFRITGLSAGSLASPSLQFTSDANTGIYSPAAEQVAIVCAGAAAATFTTGAVGPHAIGGATNTLYQLSLIGTFTPTTADYGVSLRLSSTVNAQANLSAFGLEVAPTFVETTSGTHTELAAVRIAPTIAAGAASVTDVAGIIIQGITAQATTTNASGLKIIAAPTGATNNYALWVDAGSVRIDGTDGAGAGAGTLATAPSAGDPDKWIPINSDGTQYWVPAWAA